MQMKRITLYPRSHGRSSLGRLFSRRRLASAIYTPAEFRKLIDLESARADRYHTRFSLAVFEVGTPDENSVLIRRLVRTLHNRFRNTDELGWYSHRQIGVILPFTPAEGAWKLAEYICNVIASITASPAFTIYTYPSQNWPRKSFAEKHLSFLNLYRTFGEMLAAKVPPPDAFHALIARERSRSDRNGNIFSMIAFRFDSPDMTAYAKRKLVNELYNRLRDTDELGWYDDQHIAAILPYANAEIAGRIAESICRKAGLAGTGLFEVYTYPESWFPPARHSVPKSTTDAPHKRDAAARPTMEVGDAARSTTAAANATDGETPDFLYPPMSARKRALDLIGGLLTLALLSPLFLLTAIIIKLVSPGPVLFRQERVGYMRKPFTLYKFRTMQVNSDTSVHNQYVRKLIVEDSESHVMTKLENLPQIIPCGRIIRTLCIDELPQLFNVILGNMSLVGPRPCLPYEADEYLRWHARRFNTVPGMTGLWQVSGKNRTTFKEMIRFDIQYEQRRTLAMDIKILLLTPLAILKQLLDRFTPPPEPRPEPAKKETPTATPAAR